MRVLAIIPARGGSKGVPRKNLRPVGGRPLLAHTVELARAARHLFHRAVVSTDDETVAGVARELGADVPFLRPAELATDRTPMLPVVRHALERVETEDGLRMDWVCLLQPTAPFRTVDDLAGALALARETRADSVISVVRVFAVHPALMKRVEDGRLVPFCVEEPEGTRRQDYDPPAYMRNGAIYLTRREAVMAGSLWGREIEPFVMPESRSLSIDSELDLRMADLLMRERGGETGS